MNQERKIQIEEEINLIDYFKIILKRKRLILILFLVGLIGAGVLTLLFPLLYPPIYIVETYLEIGKVSGEQVEERLIETPDQLAEKIKNGIYGNYPGLEVSNPQNTNIIKIEMVTRDPENAKKTLEDINNLILADHNDKINAHRVALEKNIEKIQKDIDFLIPRAQQVASLHREIYNLLKKLEYFQPTTIIYEPTVAVSEKKPNIKKSNLILNLAIGGILGIFLGICLAFGKEWWEKNKVKI